MEEKYYRDFGQNNGEERKPLPSRQGIDQIKFAMIWFTKLYLCSFSKYNANKLYFYFQVRNFQPHTYTFQERRNNDQQEKINLLDFFSEFDTLNASYQRRRQVTKPVFPCSNYTISQDTQSNLVLLQQLMALVFA